MPEQIDAKNKPSFKNKAYHGMARAWRLVDAVSRGTLYLRDQTTTYLPKFPAEHEDDYKDRVGTATFFNAFNRTVQGLVGMVFRKNPVLGADVPAEIAGSEERKGEGHAESIDGAGTHLDVFAKEVLKDAFDGHAFVLVDMEQPLGEGATLADELASGRRPYWVRYKASQAVNFHSVKINGRLEIGLITFEEVMLEPDGAYGEREVARYRSFRLEQVLDAGGQHTHTQVRWELLRKSKDESSGQEIYVSEGGGIIPKFTRIPVAVVYGRKTGFLESQPVLLDLALTNIKYFQKRSDYDSSLHKAGFPIPVFIGVPDEWNMLAVGAGFGIKLPQGADAKYMEPAGASLEVARQDLQDVRAEMAALGLSVLAAKPDVATTATENVINFAQESSELETIARSLKDCLETCLGFHAQYLGKESGGSVSLGEHLKSLRLDAQQITTYSEMVAKNQLTVKTLWDILQSGDALPDTFNREEEQKGIEEQQKAAAALAQKQADNSRPGAKKAA